ncbi:hypothetical protein [Nocardia sp. NPDC005366]
MDHFVALFLLLIAVVVAVVIASYITVMATYWFELRHSGGAESPEIPATR